MKKISAVFDGLKFSQITLSYAIALAKDAKAVLSGVFPESFLYHSYNMEDTIGKYGVSQIKINKHLREDQKARDHSARLFVKACSLAKIVHSLHRDTGVTLMEIIRESIYSDLLLISSEDTFSKVELAKPSLLVRELLAEAKCPLLVVSAPYQKIERIIMLYDGRPRAVTAIKTFYHLFTWMQKLPIEVVSLTSDDQQLPDLELMEEFINCHYPQARHIKLTGTKPEALLEHLQQAATGTLVVIGANQRSLISRWFSPTLAEQVLESIAHPVFIVNS